VEHLKVVILTFFIETGLPFLRRRAGDYRHFNLITDLQALVTILPAST